MDNLKPYVVIVRCKECVKRMREDCPMCNCCKLDRVPTEDDDFCSYGVCKTNTTAEEKPTPIRDYMVHGEREGE